ncbi:MAG: CBS domain-containing protein, partial [Caldisericia bacterium]|nr:CBS domain-containing protein [Caldisericia bacterium]
MKKKNLLTPKKICISHSYADFDAIATTIAATKLYPGSIPVINQSTENEVQRFLAIYKDYFNFVQLQDISFENIEQIVLTDTQDIEKIRPLQVELKKRDIEIIIYDHHPLEVHEESIKVIVKYYGAAMTLLYEKLKRKRIQFNPIEATLFIIGIYEDTGSLTFPSTTPKDLEAAAFFLKNGAKLNIISEFIFPPLQDNQKKLFALLLESIATYSIKGVQLAIAAVNFSKYVNGISFLAHRLMVSVDVDVLFVIVKSGNKTIIVARSEDDNTIPVGSIMESIGGGGHPQAGSAFIKNDEKSLDEWTMILLRLAKNECKISKLVEDYMSSPVKVINDSSVAGEALKIMLRYGHTGLPVVNKNKLVGILSRKDIERITDEKLLSRSVKSYMTKNVFWVSPESSLKEVENLIINKNIGRLPVIFNHKIVGILTRSDLLRALYGFTKPSVNEQMHHIQLPTRIKMNQWLESYLPTDHLKLIRQIGNISETLDKRAFLVGGCVRDLLLNHPCNDYDILIEGNAFELAGELEKKIPCKVIKNPEFHTAKIIFQNSVVMDLASTRTEYYEHPAALPTVSSGSLREDLYRRDFTVNCMAISLEPKRFGTLIDFYHGYDDLKHKKIRILHNLSFLEDPSRIFRAIVYSLRYSFNLEEQTYEAAINAMNSGIFKNTSRYRVLSGFIQMLSESLDIVKTMKMVEKLNALQVLSQDIVLSEAILYSLNRSKRIFDDFFSAPKWVLYILLLTISLPEQEVSKIYTRFKVNNKTLTMVTRVRSSYLLLDSKLEEVLKDSQIFRLLKNYSDNELGAFLCLFSIKPRKKILRYLNNLKGITLCL